MSDTSALGLTEGALFAGVVIGSALYGVTLLQTIYYYFSFPRDKGYLKAYVGLVWLLDTLHTVIICITTANTIMFGELANWAGFVTSILSAFITVLVQVYFLHRIWLFSKRNRFLSGFIALGMIAYLGTAILYVMKTTTNATSTWAADEVKYGLVCNGIGAGVEILISGSLITTLAREWGRFRERQVERLFSCRYSRRPRTDRRRLRLALMSITTGLWTSLCAVLIVALYAALPSTLLYATFFFFISKLYANMLLTTLNARQFVVDGMPQGSNAFTLATFDPIVNELIASGLVLPVHITKHVRTDYDDRGNENASRESIELNSWNK